MSEKTCFELLEASLLCSAVSRGTEETPSLSSGLLWSWAVGSLRLLGPWLEQRQWLAQPQGWTHSALMMLIRAESKMMIWNTGSQQETSKY